VPGSHRPFPSDTPQLASAVCTRHVTDIDETQMDPRDALHHTHLVVFKAGRRVRQISDGGRSVVLTRLGDGECAVDATRLLCCTQR